MSIHKYKLIERITQGSFGKIYKGIHTRTKELVAIKTEPRSDVNSLKHEARIYQYLSDVQGVPPLKWFGADDIHLYLVIPLYKENLLTRRKRLGHFSIDQTIVLSKSILSILKEIHKKGMVHCEIKPENFLVVNDDIRQVYIIDFGFTRRYSPDRQKKRASIGTPNYMSRRVHDRFEPGYYDDIESLFYVLLFLHFKKLPWDKPSYTLNNIATLKHKLMDVSGTLPTFFSHFVENINRSHNTNIPDYHKLDNLVN